MFKDSRKMDLGALAWAERSNKIAKEIIIVQNGGVPPPPPPPTVKLICIFFGGIPPLQVPALLIGIIRFTHFPWYLRPHSATIGRLFLGGLKKLGPPQAGKGALRPYKNFPFFLPKKKRKKNLNNKSRNLNDEC
jgi:hypothetical protein